MTRWTVPLVLIALAACSQKMEDDAKREPLSPSPLFSDGATVRPPVEGTVALDEVNEPLPEALPVRLPLATVERGRDRFDIFCSPCHDYAGHGNGRVVQRGFPSPPDLHAPAIRAMSDRQIYDVITAGYGVMLPYGDRVGPKDRWAIVSYVRALQLSDAVPASDLDPSLRSQLGSAP